MYSLVKTSLKLFYRLFYKVTIINGEKIENAKGVVISGNHLSNHDPLLFPAFFNKEIRFVAKEELFKIFFIKQTLKATGAIPIKRGTFDRAAINQSIKLVVGDEIDAYALKEEGKSHDEITELLMQRIADLIEKEK